MSNLTTGWHLIADIFSVEDERYLTDAEFIYKFLCHLAELSNSTVLSSHFHHFDGNGWTGALVLGESHLSIHSWPERKILNLDLFTCSGNDLTNCRDYIEQVFGVGAVVSIIPRQIM